MLPGKGAGNKVIALQGRQLQALIGQIFLAFAV